MSITISWIKNNADSEFSDYAIHRSTDKATLWETGNKLSTILDKNQITYVDSTAVPETVYYYGIGVSSTLGFIKSEPIVASSTSYPGMGGYSPTVGNQEFGFIESFTGSGLETTGHLLADTKLTATGVLTLSPATFSTGNGYKLNKCFSNGKILFAPNAYKNRIGPAQPPKTVYDNTLAPWIENPPVIEYEGFLYKFDLMTFEEYDRFIIRGVVKYPGSPSGCMPRTVLNSSVNTHWVNSYFKPTADGLIFNGITTAGVVAPYYNISTAAGPTTFNFAWCLRPVAI